MIGLALIFVSLEMIRGATEPMISHPGMQAIMAYLGGDLLTGFVIGAVFAWGVYSSVAAVLLFVTLTGQSILPTPAAAAMILGANLGGGVIAYVLTHFRTNRVTTDGHGQSDPPRRWCRTSPPRDCRDA
jgi:phosphate:Na+ symporter